jgi:hypothetical protein
VRAWVTIAICVVLVSGAAGVSSADPPRPTAAEARERAAKLLDKGKMQAKLPGEDEPLPPPPAVDRRRDDDDVSIPASGAPIAQGLMWIVVVVAAGLLVMYLVSELRGYSRVAQVAGGAAPTPEDVAAVVEKPLGDADALAAAGRFGEAIHVLLLRTFEELMRKLDRPVPRSRTSREILAEVPLPDEARGALAHLVSAVELSFFGGAEPGAEDYRTCVATFQRFATVYSKSARAA